MSTVQHATNHQDLKSLGRLFFEFIDTFFDNICLGERFYDKHNSNDSRFLRETQKLLSSTDLLMLVPVSFLPVSCATSCCLSTSFFFFLVVQLDC
jgi:hypothetical protein